MVHYVHWALFCWKMENLFEIYNVWQAGTVMTALNKLNSMIDKYQTGVFSITWSYA